MFSGNITALSMSVIAPEVAVAINNSPSTEASAVGDQLAGKEYITKRMNQMNLAETVEGLNYFSL